MMPTKPSIPIEHQGKTILLTPMRFATLALLRKFPRGQTSTALADHSDVDTTVIYERLKALEVRGLAKREWIDRRWIWRAMA